MDMNDEIQVGDNQFYDEAMRYRTALKEIKDLISENKCECISTPEYEEYERRRTEYANIADTPEERMLRLILSWNGDDQMPDNTIEVECLRCRILGVYEKAIGKYAVRLEMIQNMMSSGHPILRTMASNLIEDIAEESDEQ